MISIPPNHANHASLRPQRNGSAPASSRAAQDPADVKLIQQLASRDREVKTHERAHLAAAGGLAHGGAKFKFATGSDGRQYATSGEVSIDVSAVPNDPQATITKAQKISRAALAPANPSQADRAVAARANALAIEARVELQRATQDESKPTDEATSKPSATTHKNPYEQSTEVAPPTIDLIV